MTIDSAPRPRRRTAQVDSRKRFTCSEADPDTEYVVDVRPNEIIALIPRPLAPRGRRIIRVDARRRFQLAEMRAWGLYLVNKDADTGIIYLESAVALPTRALRELRQKASA